MRTSDSQPDPAILYTWNDVAPLGVMRRVSSRSKLSFPGKASLMSRIRNIAFVITVVLVMSGIAAGQRRPRPKPKPAPSAPATITSPSSVKRPVTVNLKEGEPVTGNFLRADAETVQVEVRSGRLTINMSEVASLVFADEGGSVAKAPEENPKESEAPASDPNLPAARKAYGALRKLAEAAKIKLPSGQYGTLLIEVRQVVEEALAGLPDSSVKIEIARTMEIYTDAGQAYGAAQPDGHIPITAEPGATLIRKYDIKPGVNRLGQADHLELDTALKTIWAAAGARLNYVAALIRQ